MKQDGIVKEIDHKEVDHAGWQTFKVQPEDQMPQQLHPQAANSRKKVHGD